MTSIGLAPMTDGLHPSQTNSELYLHWIGTWNKAVAESWRDPEFAKALVANPKEALREKFGFVFREKMTLIVEPVEKGSADEDGNPHGWTTGADGPGGWHLPCTEVRMFLPPPPEASEEAVAVMAYWETGQALPFSTLCLC